MSSQYAYREMLARLVGGMGAWADQAACKDMKTAVFYPERGESPAPARAVCRRCPVRTECLEFALETHERAGVWGGLTHKERMSYARTRRLKAIRDREA